MFWQARQGFIAGRAALDASVSVTPTAWNPSDKASNISLTNSNLTATITGADGFGLVRSVASKTTGKFYYEIKIDNAAGGVQLPGISNSSLPLTTFMGTTSDALGYQVANGFVYLNSSTLATIATATTNDIVGVAVDIGAKLIWFRTNAGNWNNNGANNPATATGGIDFSAINAGPYYAAFMINNNTDAGTANFGATAFSNSAPSGFGVWG